MSTPDIYNQRQTPYIMLLVCLATLPSIIVQLWFFGWGTLVQIFLGCISALFSETLVLLFRRMDVRHILTDNSALLTGMLLAISIPPLSPWWMIISGNIFSVIIAKQLYGGLGHNLFNPAMVGYVSLLISFPAQMTNWFLPNTAGLDITSLMKVLHIIFVDHIILSNDLSLLHIGIDGISQATPLNAFKTSLHTEYNVQKITQYSMYSDILIGTCWGWINLSWFLGGLFLLWKRVIYWHIPVSFLITLTFCSTVSWVLFPNCSISPKIHLLSGATMLGAFFILTDPVTASATNSGRLIFGMLSGLLVWLIRSFSTYSDGVAFATLLSNIAVPLIDYYTRPKTYGH